METQDSTGIIVASHGPLAAALIETARAIIGDAADHAVAVSLAPDESLEAMREKVAQALAGLSSALVLVDLYGGTPSNATAWAAQGREVAIVAGANLTMLLEALLAPEGSTPTELAAIAMEAGHAGIVDVVKALGAP